MVAGGVLRDGEGTWIEQMPPNVFFTWTQQKTFSVVGFSTKITVSF